MSLINWITNQDTTPRLERKYYLPATHESFLPSLIKFHPGGMREIFFERQVNNLYFDDLSLNSFQDNLMGASIRFKCRLRWYGKLSRSTFKPNLEIKCKQADLGYKWIMSLTNTSLKKLASSNQIRSYLLNHHLPQPVTEAIKRVKPVLFNSYLRSYWISFDGKVRLTIDRQLKFTPQLFNFMSINNARSSNKVVVELKYFAKDENSAIKLIQELPLQISKNSKFVDGMAYGLI